MESGGVFIAHRQLHAGSAGVSIVSLRQLEEPPSDPLTPMAGRHQQLINTAALGTVSGDHRAGEHSTNEALVVECEPTDEMLACQRIGGVGRQLVLGSEERTRRFDIAGTPELTVGQHTSPNGAVQITTR